jgi:hypothetical protein|tara:strand:+ start:652 stop:825 length:174 start_codon:yes stop_codon:yes gene_type:complete
MTTKINNDVNVSDREKFEQWLKQCPVTIQKREDFFNGFVEMHIIIKDEREEEIPSWI